MLEQAGEGHAALQQWLIVDALDSNHPTARAQISALQLTLKQRSAQLMAQGQDARRRGRSRTARKLFLQALAADPDNDELRQLLVDTESSKQLAALERRRAKAASKSRLRDEQALQTVAAPLSPRARKAETLYQNAIDALEDDPARARGLLEQVLQLVPTHLGARAYLDSLPAAP